MMFRGRSFSGRVTPDETDCDTQEASTSDGRAKEGFLYAMSDGDGRPKRPDGNPRHLICDGMCYDNGGLESAYFQVGL